MPHNRHKCRIRSTEKHRSTAVVQASQMAGVIAKFRFTGFVLSIAANLLFFRPRSFENYEFVRCVSHGTGPPTNA